MNQKTYAPVTVVIPCFRCDLTIQRAVASVSAQTVPPAEVILVDDASGSTTAAVLAAVVRAYPGWVRLITLERNVGAGAARNVGWSVASQEFVAFLDADDTWHPKKVAIQCRYMQSNPDVVLSGHAHCVLRDSQTAADWLIDPMSAQQAVTISKREMLISNRFITPSVMLRRSIPERFAYERRHMEDHLLWLEVVCNGGLVVRLQPKLAAIYKYSFGASGLSAQMWRMACADLGNYRILYKNGYLSFAIWLALSALSLLKYGRRLLVRWGRQLVATLFRNKG